MCSDATNGEYEGFKVKNEVGCSWEGEATTSESRLHLSDILEMLIRLDQQEIFMNAVDDSSAPDYSKVIEKPMCFQKMREKVHSEQYTSWVSFVEDFECICHNAMNYNQKCTKIWNAANLLLRQGKRCLEQQSARYGKILGISKVHSGINVQEEVAAKVRLDLSCHGTRLNTLSRNLDKPNCFTSTENLMSNLCEKRGPISTEGDSTISEMVVREKLAFSFASDPSMKSLDEDVNVETLTLEPEEDTRLNLEDQATECSSSFSGTQSEVEGDSCEEESHFRNGNGAGMPSGDSSATSKRRKRALDSDWKTCRRELNGGVIGLGCRSKSFSLRPTSTAGYSNELKPAKENITKMVLWQELVLRFVTTEHVFLGAGHGGGWKSLWIQCPNIPYFQDMEKRSIEIRSCHRTRKELGMTTTLLSSMNLTLRMNTRTTL